MAVSSLIHQPCLNFLLAFSSTLFLNHRLVEYAHFNGHADQPILWIQVKKVSCEQEPGCFVFVVVFAAPYCRNYASPFWKPRSYITNQGFTECFCVAYILSVILWMGNLLVFGHFKPCRSTQDSF